MEGLELGLGRAYRLNGVGGIEVATPDSDNGNTSFMIRGDVDTSRLQEGLRQSELARMRLWITMYEKIAHQKIDPVNWLEEGF